MKTSEKTEVTTTNTLPTFFILRIDILLIIVLNKNFQDG
jgi:hypothetical protein